MIKKFISLLIPSYVNYWVRAFDFKGRTKRIDFWAASVMRGLIYFPFRLFTNLAPYIFEDQVNASIAVSFAELWLAVNIVPLLAMAIRRIRDAGDGRLWWLALLIPIDFLFSMLFNGKTYSDWNSTWVYLNFILIWFYIKPSRNSRKLNSDNQRSE